MNKQFKKPKKFGHNALDKKILNVYHVDKKRAFVIIKYFNDMFLNLENIYKVLKKNSFYTIVVGDCLIRNNKFETAEYLSFFANHQIPKAIIDNGMKGNIFVSQFSWYLRKNLPTFLGGFKNKIKEIK